MIVYLVYPKIKLTSIFFKFLKKRNNNHLNESDCWFIERYSNFYVLIIDIRAVVKKRETWNTKQIYFLKS